MTLLIMVIIVEFLIVVAMMLVYAFYNREGYMVLQNAFGKLFAPNTDHEIADSVAVSLDDLFADEPKVNFEVVGESRRNTDGSDRQRILRSLRKSMDAAPEGHVERVELKRERNNDFDRNAIAVRTRHGVVGYMSREDASVLAPWIDGGKPLFACVEKLRGGDAERPSIGIWLYLSPYADFGAGVLAEQAQARAQERAAEKEERARLAAAKKAAAGDERAKLAAEKKAARAAERVAAKAPKQ